MAHKKNTISRRKFILETTAGVAVASTAGIFGACYKPDKETALPKRVLGKTGLEVSILSFGGGSQFLKNKDGQWEPLLEYALNAGINYFDTSSTYQWGASMSSEERYGKILPQYRKQIILSTKIETRDVDDGLKEFERSLKRMKTDYVDVLLVHSIEADEDIDALEKGLYKELLRLKEQGVARFIGFSSMNSAEKSKEMMERLPVDVALLAMNPTKYGNFARVALPIAREKNVGVLAMKVMRNIVGKEATPKELLHYAWNQDGVATALVGHYGLNILKENIRLTREFGASGRTAINTQELETRLAHLAGPHALCWARPDYFDGKMC